MTSEPELRVENIYVKEFFDRNVDRRGRQYFIPAYQREYTWGLNELGWIHRLLEDIAGRIKESAEADEEPKRTFLGSIILATMETVKLSQSKKQFDSESEPQFVYQIIDGQQRITTLLLVLAAFDYEMQSRIHTLRTTDAGAIDKERRKIEDELAQTLKNKVKQTHRVIKKLLLIELRPRIGREGSGDFFSDIKGKGKYESEVAQFLHTYSLFSQNLDNRDTNELGDFDLKDKFDGIHDFVARDFSKSDQNIEVPNDSLSIEFPDFTDLIAHSYFAKKFPAEFSDARVNLNLKVPPDHRSKKLQIIDQIGACICVIEYIFDRVCFAEIQPPSHDDGLDIFEAINSTGDPLTSLETFKPRILRELKTKEFNVVAKKPFENANNYIQRVKDREKQKARTGRLVMDFYYATTGRKLISKNSMRFQRNALRTTYDQISNTKLRDETEIKKCRENYFNLLSNTALLRDDLRTWTNNNNQPRRKLEKCDIDLDEEAAIGLRIIAKEFEIALPLIALLITAKKNSEFRQQTLNKGIKSITAFWCLYRTPETGTRNIDGKIRDLLKDHFSFFSTEDEVRKIDVSALQKELTSILENRDHKLDKAAWVEQVTKRNIYKTGQTLTRLVLLAAHHGVIPKDSSHKLEKSNDVADRSLTLKAWVSSDNFEIEHICPQSEIETQSGNWDETLSDDPHVIHKLGNLTLVPKEINGVLSNRGWNDKQTLYKYIAAKTTKKRQTVEKGTFLNEANSPAITVVYRIEQNEQDSTWKHCMRPLANYKSCWDKKVVDDRSEELAGFAFDTMMDWL